MEINNQQQNQNLPGHQNTNTTNRNPQPVKISSKQEPSNSNFFSYLILGFLFLLAGFLAFVAFNEPARVIVVTATKYTAGCATLIFFLIGLLVIMGLRSQALNLMDEVVDNSLGFFDAAKLVWKALYQVMVESFEIFESILRKLLPFITFGLALIIYFGLMYLYKSVAASGAEVTFLTIVLTVVLVGISGALHPGTEHIKDANERSFNEQFSHYFRDSFEIVLFVFFMTMDSTNLFFLPERLNVELHASLGQYNLMTRGLSIDDTIGFTINLIIATVAVELIRKALSVFAKASKYLSHYRKQANLKRSAISLAMRQSFRDNSDEMIRFVTFTVILILVFLIFPRLKLLAMLVASLTSLGVDLVMPNRLTKKYQPDIIGKILAKIFKV